MKSVWKQYGFKCPYGVPGDSLWVRETFGYDPYRNDKLVYRAGLKIDPDYPIKWKPSIHMPRKYSRITLEILDIHVERVQDISHEDIVDEGIPLYVDNKTLRITPQTQRFLPTSTQNIIIKEHRKKFIKLWDSINGKKYPWNSNPWVWVIEFEEVEHAQKVG